MSEHTTIKLSTQAMNALFPEGSGARLELQQSVLAQAVVPYVKGVLTEQVKAELRALTDGVAGQMKGDAKTLIAEWCGSQTWGKPSIAPLSPVHKLIAEQVKNTFKAEVHTAVQEAVAKAAGEPELQKYIAYRVETETQAHLTRNIDIEVRRLVELGVKAIRDAIASGE